MIPFPHPRVALKRKRVEGAVNAETSSTIPVGADEFGVVYRLWVTLDVHHHMHIQSLPALMVIKIAIGTLESFDFNVHPYVESPDHLTKVIDLGPWQFDFMPDGLYSGVKGEGITVTVSPAGVDNKTTVLFLYSTTMETD